MASEHEYLLEFTRKLDATIGDGAAVLAHVRQNCIQWPPDLWMLRMLSRLFPAETIVEIGSHKGGSMLWLAWCFRPKELICVDPLLGMSGPSAATMAGFAASADIARTFGVNARLIRKTHADAATEIEDGSVDLYFVDGNHREEAVTFDLKLGWPKLRTGGIMCGHDYCAEHPSHIGVVRGVNKWEHESETTLLLPSRIFFVRKNQ